MVAVIFLILFGFLLVGVFLEFIAPNQALKTLFYKSDVNYDLFEPDEEIKLTSKIINNGFYPILYLNSVFSLPSGANIIESKEWKSEHYFLSGFNPSIKNRTYLLPFQAWTGDVKFSLSNRGKYTFGGYFLEVGDSFGLRSAYKRGEANSTFTVIPARTTIKSVLNAYHGYIGNFSVQRFMLEDPVLTVGFREYTGREPMKSISFTKTASTGKLYVKCYDHTSDINITVAINYHGGTESSLEECMRIARSVCEDLEQKHIPYALKTNGDILNGVESGLGAYHLHSVLKKLGQSTLTSLDSLEHLLQLNENRNSIKTGLILISPPFTDNDRKTFEHYNALMDYPICLLIGGDIDE